MSTWHKGKISSISYRTRLTRSLHKSSQQRRDPRLGEAMDVPPPIPPRPAGFVASPLQPQYQPLKPSLPPRKPVPTNSPQGIPAQSPSPASPHYAPPGFLSAPVEPPPPPSRWNEHLFYSNGRETPIFAALMKEFFAKLGPQQGYITPEAFSSFLDACNYQTEHNVCTCYTSSCDIL